MLILSLLIFLILGVPIGFTLLSSTLFTQIIQGKDIQILIQRLYGANDSFSMLAIPFFFIAGELMLQGGISKRIVSFAKSLLGWIEGSMAVISFVACAFFGAISGSSFATTAAIGGLMYPEMVNDGYDKGFATAIQAVGGTLGALIPPSIVAVVYSVLVQVSAGDMFLYLVPVGVLATLVYSITAIILIKSRKEYYQPITRTDRKVNGKELWETFKDAIWALISPVIILGGIYGGVFTPTESAIVATIYSLIVGLFVYKELNLESIYKAILDSALGSAAVMFIINASAPFGWMLAINRIPHIVTEFTLKFISNPYLLMLLFNILFLIAGMFMETNAILNITVPILLPLLKTFNINLIHFGVITCFNMTIGTITPPFGGGIFVASGVTQVPVTTVFKRAIPFLLSSIIVLIIITYLPFMWLY